ncbi:hypothetical protein CC86DRAFT_252606, partial [Ophiobolus disseminans]
APPRFREDDGKRHMYMQERHLKNAWKLTPDELEHAGVQHKVSNLLKTKVKKIALFQMYEYAKNKGMGVEKADEAARTEVGRIVKTRTNYSRFQSGGYGSG